MKISKFYFGPARFVALRKEFLVTLRTSRSSLPLLATCPVTLGSRVSVVSLVIPYSSPFFVKKFRKNRKSLFFGLLGPKQNFEILMVFYIPSNFYINPLFRAPRPPGPLKSRPGGQNLPGGPLIAQSDHRGPVSAQFYAVSYTHLTLPTILRV